MWQTKLVSSILQEPSRQKQDLAVGEFSGSLPSQNLLQIYRHNYEQRLTQALQDTYGKTQTMVGLAFFEQVAIQFIYDHPFAESSLLNFGAGFAKFLRQHPLLENQTFVADLAELEWALEELYNSAPAQLVKGWQINPNCRVVSASCALWDLWHLSKENQQKADQQLNIWHQTQWVIAFRGPEDIQMLCINKQQGQLLQAILKCDTQELQAAISQIPITTITWLTEAGLLLQGD